MLISKKIKPVAIASIKLCLSEMKTLVNKSVSKSVENSIK